MRAPHRAAHGPLTFLIWQVMSTRAYDRKSPYSWPADKSKIELLLIAILELNPRKKVIYNPKELVELDPKMERRAFFEIWVGKMRWVANNDRSTHQFAKQSGVRCEQALALVIDMIASLGDEASEWLVTYLTEKVSARAFIHMVHMVGEKKGGFVIDSDEEEEEDDPSRKRAVA